LANFIKNICPSYFIPKWQIYPKAGDKPQQQGEWDEIECQEKPAILEN
jgi:hypothetical protein